MAYFSTVVLLYSIYQDILNFRYVHSRSHTAYYDIIDKYLYVGGFVDNVSTEHLVAYIIILRCWIHTFLHAQRITKLQL